MYSEEFGWHSLINKLAKDDITKFDEVIEINYITALNQLSLWHYQKEVEDYYYKKQLKR